MDEGIRREELAVHVHRVTVFEDSFRELYRRNPEEWKNRFYIVFEGMDVVVTNDLNDFNFSMFFFVFKQMKKVRMQVVCYVNGMS